MTGRSTCNHRAEDRLRNRRRLPYGANRFRTAVVLTSLVAAFRRNLPNTPIACEAVQDSTFFDRTFDAALAWGLMFMLSADDQRRLIQRISDILLPGGRLLFTSPAEIGSGNDVLTGREFRSLGAEEYRRLLSAVGLSVPDEYEDEGGNHYYDGVKSLMPARPKTEMSA